MKNTTCQDVQNFLHIAVVEHVVEVVGGLRKHDGERGGCWGPLMTKQKEGTSK